jgi:glycosyltransferase involved in cell wall biosynthesis
MRVLHVVTLLDPEGSFGGPVRVAVNQIKELSTLNVDAVIAGGARGFEGPVYSFEGIDAVTAPVYRLFPGAGFSGLVSPRLIGRVVVLLRHCDVVHVHLSRDLITLPIALLALIMRKPLVVQTHGMVDPSTRILARALDLLATKWILRRANALLYLTSLEERLLEQVARRSGLSTFRLPNGVPSPVLPIGPRHGGTVLFASRLHKRKQPGVFVRAAAEAAKSLPWVRFVIVGADEGELSTVQQLIRNLNLSSVVSYLGPLPHAQLLEQFRRAALYVLPSVDEPYPMTVLEAMSLGTPVIISTSCGLASDVRRTNAGMVVDPTVTEVARAMVAMLNDPDRRYRAGLAGAAAAQVDFTIASVSAGLLRIYQRATKVSDTCHGLDQEQLG